MIVTKEIKEDVYEGVVKPQGHSGAYVNVPQKHIGKKCVITITKEHGINTKS